MTAAIVLAWPSPPQDGHLVRRQVTAAPALRRLSAGLPGPAGRRAAGGRRPGSTLDTGPEARRSEARWRRSVAALAGTRAPVSVPQSGQRPQLEPDGLAAAALVAYWLDTPGVTEGFHEGEAPPHFVIVVRGALLR